jgi:hypothetical protein
MIGEAICRGGAGGGRKGEEEDKAETGVVCDLIEGVLYWREYQ